MTSRLSLHDRLPWQAAPVPSAAVIEDCREALEAVRASMGTIRIQDSTGRTLLDQIEIFQRLELFWDALPHAPREDTPADRAHRLARIPPGTTTIDNTPESRAARIAHFARLAANPTQPLQPLSREVIAGVAHVLGLVSPFQLTHLSRRDCQQLAPSLGSLLSRYGGATQWSPVHSLLEAPRLFFEHAPGQPALHAATWEKHATRWWEEAVTSQRVEEALATLTALGRILPDAISTPLILTMPSSSIAAWIEDDPTRRARLAAWIQTGVGASSRERTHLTKALMEGVAPAQGIQMARKAVEAVRAADPKRPETRWHTFGAQELVLFGLTQAGESSAEGPPVSDVPPVAGGASVAERPCATDVTPVVRGPLAAEGAPPAPSRSDWVDLALDVLAIPSPVPNDPTKVAASAETDWEWARRYNGQQSLIWTRLLSPVTPMTPAQWTSALNGTFARGMTPATDGTLQMLLSLRHIPPGVVADFLATTMTVPLRDTVAKNRALMADARIRKLLLAAGRSKPVWRLLFDATTDPAEAVTLLEYLVQCGAQEEAERLVKRWSGVPLQLSTGLLKIFLASGQRETRMEAVLQMGATTPAVRPLTDLPARSVRRTPKR